MLLSVIQRLMALRARWMGGGGGAGKPKEPPLVSVRSVLHGDTANAESRLRDQWRSSAGEPQASMWIWTSCCASVGFTCGSREHYRPSAVRLQTVTRATDPVVRAWLHLMGTFKKKIWKSAGHWRGWERQTERKRVSWQVRCRVHVKIIIRKKK